MNRIGVSAIVTAAAAAVTGLAVHQNQDVEARVAQLEARVARLETFHGTAAPLAETGAAAGGLRIPVTITDKRFRPADAAHGSPLDTIWWNSRFDLKQLAKDARALKGVLEFRDLFGETQVSVSFTITDALKAGAVHRSTGDGIDYSHSRSGHAWLRSTDVKDMQVEFVVRQVIYADGSRAEYK